MPSRTHPVQTTWSFGIVFHCWKLCLHLVCTLQNIPEAALCFMKRKNSHVCQLMLVKKKKILHSYSYCLPCACGFFYRSLFEMSATESVSKCIRPPEWQYKWGLAAVDATDNFQKTTHRLWCYFGKRLPYRSEEENCQMATCHVQWIGTVNSRPKIEFWYWSWTQALMILWHPCMFV